MMGKRLSKSLILRTKSLKEQTKTCSGQVKCDSYLSQGQQEFEFFQALLFALSGKVHAKNDSHDERTCNGGMG